MATSPNTTTDAALRSVWQIIHRAALAADAAPAGEQESAARLFRDMLFGCRILLCADCVVHMTEYINQHPLPPAHDRATFAYTVNFHNDVNSRLGKAVVSVDEARRIHQSTATDTSCPSSPPNADDATPQPAPRLLMPSHQLRIHDPPPAVYAGAAVATGLAWLGLFGFLVSRAAQ